MLYKKNTEKVLSDELFRNPTSEYRGTPFWAWNSFLTKEELCRQIEVFKEMGLGGFHMHVRTGLENRYLDDDFMALVKACVEKAKDEKMLAYLYDEDRWPSGAAGGIVTENVEFRERRLFFSKDEADDAGELKACYDVILNADGGLEGFRRISESDDAEGEKWFLRLRIGEESSWYNGKTYIDTLNRDAVEKFIEVTHERYFETVGDEFDKTVPSIFTDEPQFTRKRRLGKSVSGPKDFIYLPWTDKAETIFKEQFGVDPFDVFPEFVWEKADGSVSVNRYHYHELITELFASAFADTVGSWCRAHNLALTGHMMEEPRLFSQTASIGEAMRSYRGFDLPGIDMLCNHHEFTTAKQAQSAAHQFGYEGVLSELYGVTGWDADFRLYRHQGDWQAALGITIRVPHLSWYAMKGEAKRDYPASIHYQSPWYKEYSAVEDHFARVNTAMTRGKPVVKVGVIHPVESYWLHFGPEDKTNVICSDMDERFESFAKWMLEGTIDYDYISESLLPTMCEKGSAPLGIGKMEYETIIVPACETLRSTTLEILEQFRADGGRLIFLGEAPTLENAIPSERGKELFEKSEKIDFSRASIIGALESERIISLRRRDGRMTDDLLYQLREDSDCSWLFIAHTKEPYNKFMRNREDVTLTIRGEFAPVLYDTESGETKMLSADYENGMTKLDLTIFAYDSVLLKLVPGRSEVEKRSCGCSGKKTRVFIENPDRFELSEPNVLVLDIAEFRLDGGEFRPKEEILRLDNILREELGLEGRGGHVVQPWARPKEELVHRATLRFRFESEIEFEGAELALECAKDAKIVFNGEEVSNEIIGNYVDVAIDKVKLPKIVRGENVLEITWPFGNTTDLENVFILGDFGVEVKGEKAKIIPFPAELLFGDICAQGFPFFGGAVKYDFRAKAAGGKMLLNVSYFRGTLVKVFVDGEAKGRIIYPPYELEIDGLADGEHKVTLEFFGCRFNTFGPIHLVSENESWHGPNAWRTEDENWTYQYHFVRQGIMKSPEVFTE